MLETELEKIIRDIQNVQSESNTVEVKTAKNGCPKVRETLSAFLTKPEAGSLYSVWTKMIVSASAGFTMRPILSKKSMRSANR